MAGSSPSCGLRLHDHLLAHLVCPSRHTITSLLTTYGRQFEDWTAQYQLYSMQRVQPDVLFRQILSEVETLQTSGSALVVALDDTLLRKTGRCIPGTAYRRDPLGPPFHVNLVWAQRVLQLAAAVPGPQGEVRMIPVDFKDASTPHKPRKNAAPEQWDAYREAMKQANLNHRAVKQLTALQALRTGADGYARPVHVLVDGSFTNRKFLMNLPPNTTVIGRIRKDAHLHFLPDQQKPCGRKRVYGEQAPTPEEWRQDTEVPWQEVTAYAAGALRTFKVKTLAPLRWRAAGKDHDIRLVVIAPIPYLKAIGRRRLYRQPAYLICTDPNMPLATLLQEYIWRWDIEVNHRDEKTLLGVGQAQVRNPHSVESVPAVAVAAYAMLHLAAIKAFGWNGKPDVLPLPKWRDPDQKKRASTMDLINELRRELWTSAIRPSHLIHFMHPNHHASKSKNSIPSLPDALFYSTN